MAHPARTRREKLHSASDSFREGERIAQSRGGRQAGRPVLVAGGAAEAAGSTATGPARVQSAGTGGLRDPAERGVAARLWELRPAAVIVDGES